MPPQSSPRAAWPSNDDNGGFFLIVLGIGLVILAFVLWTNFHGLISGGVIQAFHWEIGWLRSVTDRFNLADRQMMSANPETVRLKDLYGIAHAVGTETRIPAACIMLVLGSNLHGASGAITVQARLRHGRAHRGAGEVLPDHCGVCAAPAASC